MAEIPVIRMDYDPTKEATTVQTLRKTCREVGFFYLEGHGVPDILLNQVLEQTQRLFGLEQSAKKNLSDHVLSRGYTAMEEETLDPQVQTTRGDTKEGFYIGRDIACEDPHYDPSKLRGPNIWPTPATVPPWSPEQCEEFRVTMMTYHEQMTQVGIRLIRLLALAIGLERTFFDDYFLEEPMATLRLLQYAAVESQPAHGIFGCGAHSDYGMITLLLTDDTTPGLQILSSDQKWIDVPPRQGAFVVNLGDLLARWTNDLFQSTIHRVLTAGNGRKRVSCPFFLEPNFDTLVTCLEPCCSLPDNPPKYPPTTAGGYLIGKYKQTHADFQPADEG